MQLRVTASHARDSERFSFIAYIRRYIYIYIHLSLSITANFFATASSDVQLVGASVRPKHTGEHCSDVKLTAARPAESRRAFRIIGNSDICSSASCERSYGTIGRSEAILLTNWRFRVLHLRRCPITTVTKWTKRVFKRALMRFVKSVVQSPRPTRDAVMPAQTYAPSAAPSVGERIQSKIALDDGTLGRRKKRENYLHSRARSRESAAFCHFGP